MKRILITGGASGLGKAITKKLASIENFKVFVTYNNSIDSAVELENSFPNIKSIKCDFSKTEDIDNLLVLINEVGINVLINNALTSLNIQHFHKTNVDIYQNSFLNNVIPTIKITKDVIKICRKKKFGKIINILSSAIINVPPIGWSEYTANKAYLFAMSKSWAIENAKFNITSNCISPQFMHTKLHKDLDTRVVEEIVDKHPLKKILQPEEVADIVFFYVMCSAQVNGTNFIVNAGTSMV